MGRADLLPDPAPTAAWSCHALLDGAVGRIIFSLFILVGTTACYAAVQAWQLDKTPFATRGEAARFLDSCGDLPPFDPMIDQPDMFSSYTGWKEDGRTRVATQYVRDNMEAAACPTQSPGHQQAGPALLPMGCFSDSTLWRELRAEPCDRCATAATLGGPETAEECQIVAHALTRGVASCGAGTGSRATESGARFDARSWHAVDAGDSAAPCAIPCASGSSPGDVHYGMRFLPVRRRRAANVTRRYYPAACAEGRGAGTSCPPPPAAPGSDGLHFVPPPGERQRVASARPPPGLPPSFAIVLFDAAPQWTVESALRSIAQEVAGCGRRPGSMSGAWTMHRFAAHNTAGMNTMPNLLALLAGAAPKRGQQVMAPRIADYAEARHGGGHHGKESVDQVALYNCRPDYTTRYYCSTFAHLEKDMGPGGATPPLYAALSASHLRMHSTAWMAKDDGPAHSLFSSFADEGHMEYVPDHVVTGPFAVPLGYGTSHCEHGAVRNWTSHDRSCVANHPVVDLDIDYASRFDDLYPGIPTFSFSILYDTHNSPERMPLATKSLRRRLRRLAARADAEDTFFLISSDHGPHSTPFLRTDMHHRVVMWWLVPRRFQRRFPREAAALYASTRKPTTHRDVYWTIRDLVALYEGKERPTIPPNARSLIKRPPQQGAASEHRSCREALIADEYCGPGWSP